MFFTRKSIDEYRKKFVKKAKDEVPFEITKTKDMSKAEATKKIDDNYHDNLTYKGHEFFDKVYMNKIMTLAEKELDASGHSGQESYLGYLPDKDIFISGWDMFSRGGGGFEEDEEESSDRRCVVFIKIDDNLNTTVVDTPAKTRSYYYGMMYPENYRKLQTVFPNLIDIRLD